MAKRIALLALTTALVSACEPTCKQTCRRLIECDQVDTPRQGLNECQAACEIQQRLYEDWDDQQARAAFADIKQCIKVQDCESVADGVCYDADLYVW